MSIYMKKNFTLMVVGLILSSCTAASYQHTPTAKLCIDYLTSSPWAFYSYHAQEATLRQRGETCADYVDSATKINAARAAAAGSAQGNSQMLMKQGQQMMKNGRLYNPSARNP